MYGTVYGIDTAVIHVAHPIPARKILVSCSTKAPAYNHFYNFSGRGVFTADGEEWKSKRASVLHCLIRNMGDNLEQEVNQAADRLLSDFDAASTEEEKTNVVPFLQRATIGLIYRYITHDKEMDTRLYHDNTSESDSKKTTKQLSSSSSSSPSSSSSSLTSLAETESWNHDDDKREVQRQQQESSSQQILPSYLKSITDIRMILLAQSRSVWFLLPRWIYERFSNMYRQEEQTMGPIREFATLACQNAKSNSPLGLLKTRHSHASDDKKSILDEAITLLFAGQDTSAATLSWTLHLLSLHPEIQDKVAKEILRETQQEDYMSKKTISKLTYLDAVIKESMRLYPVAPFVVRKLCREVQVDQKTSLPKGALACVWIYGLHRNPKLWDRPNDFVPERWLETSNSSYMPFCVGPRNCVGQPLAHVILRILLARLVQGYEFVDPLKEQKDMQAGFTVLPDGGVELVLRKRKHC